MTREMPEPDYIEQLRAILGDIRGHAGEPLPPHLEAQIHDERRRHAIQELIERGATEGERMAARAAMERLDVEAMRAEDERAARDLQDALDEEEAAAFGEL